MKVLCFQDSNSPLMMHINHLHDHIMVVIIMIISIVMYVLLTIVMNPCSNRFFFGSEVLELIWTLAPSIVLAILAIPSLHILYLMDELKPMISIKSIGHQWYWSYEYGDLCSIEFDSYMIMEQDLELGMMRLLEVDNRTVIPVGMEIRMLITSTDVIHSWTIPTLGVKMDGVPGRLNQIYLSSNICGLMYGQCSEICGSFHSFMPICLEVLSESRFMSWLNLMIK
uniref:Cytochrome c oxidase subunit 2 n=1 Tax=Ibidoecus bisignatus TaxID=236520 RepID=G1EN77_9NEOP|nr:cytochrome c oxidase subunit II [Ibidoecus bisignatus]AEM23860.1 cytochrome c oxidase subunit II [Ibidoecus bisignatus]